MALADKTGVSADHGHLLRHKPSVPGVAVVLGVISVIAALGICYITYRNTMTSSIQRCKESYLDIAHVLASESMARPEVSDEKVLEIVKSHWDSMTTKPADSYICIIDSNANLILHTAYPETIGNYTGDNIIKGNETRPQCTLKDLIKTQEKYVGGYISSAGQDQIAAFVPVPQRKWVIGMHRSRKALVEATRYRVKHLYIGMVAVCGVLMPTSFLLLYATFYATQRKKYLAEKAVGESELKYKTLLENIPQKIFYKNTDSVYMSCNQSFAEEFGITSDEIIGTTDFDHFPKELAEKYRADDRRIIQTCQTEEIEEAYIKHDVEYTIHTVKTPVKDKDGKVVGVLGIFWDITEKKMAEKMLHMTQFSIDSAAFEIFWVSQDASFLYANDYACQMLGYSLDELLSLRVMDVNPSFTPENWKLYWQEIKKRKSIKQEGRHRRKDGSTFPVEVIVNYLEYEGRAYNFVYATDITERKTAEMALRYEKDRLQVLADGLSRMHIGVDIVNIDHQVLWQNQVLTDRFGDLTDKVCYKRYLDLDEPCTECPMQKAIDTNTAQRVELKGADGRDYEILSSPLANADGSIDKVIELIQDISERKEAQEALSRSERLFRAHFELGMVGTAITSPNKEWLVVNDNLCKMLGFSREELTQKTWSELTHPEDLQADVTEFNKVVDGTIDGYTLDKRFICKDGKVLYTTLSLACLRYPDGSVEHFIAHIQDITERKIAEDVIHASEVRFKALFDNMPSGAAVYDVEDDGRAFIFEDVNKAGQDSLGVTKKELIGRRLDEVFPGTPEMKGLFDGFKKVWKTGESEHLLPSFYQDEHMTRWYENFVYKLSTGELVAIFHDVTEREKARQDREELLRVLDSKNQELQSIVYIASHDLRTPLVNISGFSGMLHEHCQELEDIVANESFSDGVKNKVKELLDEGIPEDLEFIRNATNQMSILIDGLLKVSRVGTTQVNTSMIDMNQAISEIITMVSFQAEEKHAVITCDELPECICDPRQIRQLFSNLINNALKYLDPDRDGRIHISGHLHENRAIYCVQDNGRGIEKAHQRKIFEIYHRLNPKDGIGGEGLGLTIVRRILDRHNGDIWLESEPSVGSKFYVGLDNSIEKG